MQLKPTVALYLDVRKQLKNKKFMLKLRVTFSKDGKFIQKYFSTGYSLSTVQWDAFRSSSVPYNLRKMRVEVLKFEAKANDIISDVPTISMDLFGALLTGKYSKQAGAAVLFKEMIAKFESSEQIGTAEYYTWSMKSLEEFRPGFTLEVVDVDFLKAYEAHMVSRGNSLTTVGFYLRALRAVFNVAIDKHVISRDLYPFGRGGYTIPKGSKFKKALKKTDKTSLEGATMNEEERRAVAFWMFSFYCNGMNFKDIAYLTRSSIQDEVITFVREKTKRTVREQKEIVPPIRPAARKILEEYGTHEPYIFGIITEEMTARQKYNRIKDWIKETNTLVNQVAARIGITGKVNTYAARHTFATTLLKGKVDLKAIQQSLGHTSISTTESYLADLDIEEAKRISELLD